MKKLSLTAFLVLLIFTLFSQPFQLTDKIPFNPATSKGTLKNGLTYYVKSNSTPKNRAEMMLVVSAGSVLEDPDQLGIAHFCEHMSFNGTKNFPKNELVKYFESIGMEFGPEINAYTSFDETVYMIKVPLDKEEYIQKGLQVLFDWASQETDSDEEINKERGVIHEEWRGGQGAQKRMMNQWLPMFLKDSKYADRLPIGKMEIVDKCNPEVVRRFRSDWYRPDLQAIIVVGDFDQKKMVKMVSVGSPQTITNITYTRADFCQKSPVNFVTSVNNKIDQLIWDFGDSTGLVTQALKHATTDTISQISHTYLKPGLQSIKVKAFSNGCESLADYTLGGIQINEPTASALAYGIDKEQ
ncbi:MAG: insulinase family protein, partial [Mariniphaga sp.]